ncbi:MAG: glycosyltransferase 87 family protein [Actinomycetota bacterium]|nr:glycosyltransferase 87 family protein [Actinomycetota bacterium]
MKSTPDPLSGPKEHQRAFTPPSVAVTATLIIIVAALVLRWMHATTWSLVDLEDFVAGGRSVLQGQQIYDPIPGVLPFNYPPFGAVVMVPLGAVGLPLAAWLLTLVSLVGYVLVGALVARRLGVADMVTTLFLLGGLALEPLVRNLVLGQVNLLLVALVVIDLLVLPPPWRGVLIGLAAGVKLTPAVFVVYYVLKRDWWAVARSVGAFVGTVAVGWWLAPASSARYWLEDLDKTMGFGADALLAANQSLRAVIVHASGDERPPTEVWVPLAVVILVAATLVARHCLRHADDVGAMLALAVGGLLASPISWTHHWVWVVPALMYAYARFRTGITWVLAAVFYVAPMWFLPAGGGAELRFSAWQVVVSGVYVIAGLVGLALLAVSSRAAALPGPRAAAPLVHDD